MQPFANSAEVNIVFQNEEDSDFHFNDLITGILIFGHVSIFLGNHHSEELSRQLILTVCKLEAADAQ